MQSDWKEIYRLTAERTGESEELYKDLGNFIFHELYLAMKKPKSLIIKLRGVGSWHLRRMRMQKTIELFPPNFDKKPEDFTHPLQIFKHENKIELYNIFQERLKDYDKYVELRNSIKNKRNEGMAQTPIGDQQSGETSKTESI